MTLCSWGIWAVAVVCGGLPFSPLVPTRLVATEGQPPYERPLAPIPLPAEAPAETAVPPHAETKKEPDSKTKKEPTPAAKTESHFETKTEAKPQSPPEGKPQGDGPPPEAGKEENQATADMHKAAAVIDGGNEVRAQERLPPLKPDPLLQKAARAHAVSMARQDKYGDSDTNGHILNGKGPSDRVEQVGYQYAAMAENVAFVKGVENRVADVLQGWKDSPGHRANLLEKNMTETGAGVAQGASGRWYFCQMFGRPRALMKDVTVWFENNTEKALSLRVFGPGDTVTVDPKTLVRLKASHATRPPYVAYDRSPEQPSALPVQPEDASGPEKEKPHGHTAEQGQAEEAATKPAAPSRVTLELTDGHRYMAQWDEQEGWTLKDAGPKKENSDKP